MTPPGGMALYELSIRLDSGITSFCSSGLFHRTVLLGLEWTLLFLALLSKKKGSSKIVSSVSLYSALLPIASLSASTGTFDARYTPMTFPSPTLPFVSMWPSDTSSWLLVGSPVGQIVMILDLLPQRQLVAMLFSRSRDEFRDPDLYLYGRRLPVAETTCFLD